MARGSDTSATSNRVLHPRTSAHFRAAKLPTGPGRSGARSLSTCYQQAMQAGITGDDDLAAAEKKVRAHLRLIGERWVGGDAIAVAMILRAASPLNGSGVPAAKELADRTEGPVVQRTENVTVSWVVAVPDAPPGNWEDWARVAEGHGEGEGRGDRALVAGPPALPASLSGPGPSASHPVEIEAQGSSRADLRPLAPAESFDPTEDEA